MMIYLEAPDLVPEWVPWMMQELASRGLDKSISLSDDNLSNYFFWEHLTGSQIETIRDYSMYVEWLFQGL